MNSLETLYFPDTAIISTRQAPLALLFSKINLIQPLEDGNPEEENPMDSFMNSPLCRQLPLHPLGEDKERFLYLINDIKNRKDDYAAQLSNVTLASLSEKKSPGEESKNQILSSLLGRTPQTSTSSDSDKKNVLWHARLMLKIAEMLDREEEEVAQALVFLEDSENAIFNQLKGVNDEESENLYEDMKKITSKLGKPQTQSITQRMRSWFRFIKNTPLPACSIWTTPRQEVAEILFEDHENLHNQEPIHLAKLELPAHLGNDIGIILDDVENFHKACSNIMPNFFEKLLTASSPLKDDQLYLKFQEDWQQLLEERYPAEKFGRKVSHFYRFASPITHFSGLQNENNQDGAQLLCVCV